MSGNTRFALTLFGVVIAGWVVWQLVTTILHTLLSLLVPIVIVGGIATALYLVISRKALGGGRRILP